VSKADAIFHYCPPKEAELAALREHEAAAKSAARHDHTTICRLPHPEHDCLTREHGPDEWCPDCFPQSAAKSSALDTGDSPAMRAAAARMARRSAEKEECGT